MNRSLVELGKLALYGVALGSAGCFAAAVVAHATAEYGVVQYADDEAFAEFRAGLDVVWSATLKSLHENGYPVDMDAAHGTTEGSVKVGDADVRVASEAGGSTRVRVRVGTFETEVHRRRARLILEGISQRVR